MLAHYPAEVITFEDIQSIIMIIVLLINFVKRLNDRPHGVNVYPRGA